jgi:ATP-binding cassette subfamily D (ALD) protein 3
VILASHARFLFGASIAARKMPAVLSKVAPLLVQPRVLVSLSALVAGLGIYITQRRHGNKFKDSKHLPSSTKSKSERAAVDARFFSQLLKLIKIIIPGLFTPEVGYLLMIAVMLVFRTYADVWMIQNGTAIEGSIIGRSMESFLKNLSKFVCAMPIIALINSLLKYSLDELKLRFRSRLSRHFYSRYMRGFTFYKMSNLDSRISNADQLLTQDVEKFCDTLAELYSNISKPILDISLYVYKLTGSIGAQGPLTMLAYLALSGFLLTKLRSPVGPMTAHEQHLEGQLRYVNSRIITNSEEISFYQGNIREKITIYSTFDQLIDHLRSLVLFRFSMGFIDSMVAKYLATVVGYYAVSRPFLNLSHPRHANTTHSERMMDYYSSGRMLVRMAQAIGRLVLAGRELTRLAGYTTRMSQLSVVLRDLERGVYERTMVVNEDQQESSARPSIPLVPGSGEIIETDHVIRFEGVPLVTPNGDVIIRSMDFEVKSGMNVLVCGPNGCGKSSLFRVLGELWPLFGGKLVKPHRSKLFYVPQRPYMTLGTLRDQVTYPHSVDDQARRGVTDQALEDFLAKVQLSYLLEREGRWDSVQDWMDVLSGGEKQRMAVS